MVTFVAAPGAFVMFCTALTKPVDAKVSVYCLASPVRRRFVKVNDPATALLVSVPPKVAPAEALAVIEAVEVSTLFPEMS